MSPIETSEFLYTDEPSRFEARHINELLVYCHRINASDITFQTVNQLSLKSMALTQNHAP